LQSSEEALKQTIRSYDRTASGYAERTCNIPLPSQRDWFMEYLARPGASVLDLGCGPGRDTRYYREQAYRAVGADLSLGMLEEARRRNPGGVFVQADMRCLPFKDRSFQGIWASASFLHLPKQSAGLALAEMRRVLDDSGVLFMAVKRGQEESWREPEDAPARFYFAYYRSDELAAKVRQAGFEILSLSENFSKVQTQPDGSPVCWINLYARKVRP
jgi:ubiquinone/menaquinone biosynthesis C-methylase UbiE